MSPQRRPRIVLAVGAAVLLVVGVLFTRAGGEVQGSDHVAAPSSTKQIVIGEVEAPAPDVDAAAEATNGPGVETVEGGSRLRPRAEPARSARVLPPDGHPPGAAVPFDSGADGVDDLVFVLVAGSDARPGEAIARARADSLHVVAVNPALGRGTIVGIPRDAYVEVPGHGRQKINSALALGGPQLLARTVIDLTGMPIRWYVLTGFDGLVDLTNALGGVNHHLDRRMDDRASGAHFDRGWHHLEGVEALAYSRNRKDTEFGDFSRSLNQGALMVATLAKMRAEIGDEGALGRWLAALREHVELDIGMGDLFSLGVTARRLDPDHVDNVVASGTVGTAGGRSVVFLDEEAERLFADVAEDGAVGSPGPAPTTTRPPDSTTTRPLSPTSTTEVVPVTSTTSSSTTSTALPVLGE